MILCIYCKYYDRKSEDCNCSPNLIHKHNWEREWNNHKDSPRYINKNNDCNWFKKKELINR
jgi:hypothetical protein